MDRQQAEWAANIIRQVVQRRKEKFETANILRTQMVRQINAGQKPTGYRAHWHYESAKELRDKLVEIATRFNAEHPYDVATITDLIDILHTTAGQFKQAIQGTD